MKIAVTSAGFDEQFASGTTTQLEWLDACANDLRVDGVVFDLAHLPRVDADYLAQVKKVATDLAMTVAGVEHRGTLAAVEVDRGLAIALSLGAPLLLVRAPAAGDDAAAWPAFVSDAATAARAAKRANVTLALRNAPGTLCATAADLIRIAKDVDSAWLRFAVDLDEFGPTDDAQKLVARTAVAVHRGTPARALPFGLARFRGYVIIERELTGDHDFGTTLRRARGALLAHDLETLV